MSEDRVIKDVIITSIIDIRPVTKQENPPKEVIAYMRRGYQVQQLRWGGSYNSTANLDKPGVEPVLWFIASSGAIRNGLHPQCYYFVTFKSGVLLQAYRRLTLKDVGRCGQMGLKRIRKGDDGRTELLYYVEKVTLQDSVISKLRQYTSRFFVPNGMVTAV